MSAPLLAVRGLRIASSAGVIVDGLDLDVAPGETVGIVGESGSGKSLTAKALVGLLPAGVTATGRVDFDDREILSGGERRWRRLRGAEIALMLQDPFTMLSPLMRVGPQITETIRDDDGRRLSRAAARAEAAARLAEVGIRDARVADRYPFQLSGGMRQRVGLAAALASDPRVLVADEPSTALDVTTQREILRLIRSTQERRGMSVILVTHDLRVAFAFCERIYVLYAGALLETAPTRALERQPLHPYTHGLLTSEPPLGRRVPRLDAIPGSVPAAETVRGECAFAGRCAWVEHACRAGRPSLRELGDGRSTACRRVDEISAQLVPPARAAAEPAASTANDAAPVIRIRDLAKTFDGVAALDGVSFDIGAGESVGLVGESGSGKTTLARCLVGLEKPTGGSVEIAGTEVTDYDALTVDERDLARRAVQIVFQDPYSTLNPARTVGFTLFEALRRSAARRSERARTIAELLELVGLPARYASRKPAALSGGERQRVAIARALALRPQILICDEPVSALDVSVQAQILNLLGELNAKLGLGYLFITHDLAVVRQVTDRLYVLYEGRVVESGGTEQVLGAPAHEYTRSLIASVPQSTPTWLAPVAT
ncbi:MAG: dipeptide ABC transporter ATP-binding protein [Gaiellaceae bacterium]